MALRDVGANFESWKTCEWDVNAIRQYKAIHCGDDNTDYSKGKSKDDLIQFFLSANISLDGKESIKEEKLRRRTESWLREIYNACVATHNLINIQNVKGTDLEIVDTDKYDYLLTYSFPCTDISIAGQMGGMAEGSKTHSSLLWEVKRILSELDVFPQILLMENVSAIHSKKNMSHFQKWMDFLEGLGYTNFWQDMNARDYGVPQSRNRTFMISIFDTSHSIQYEFPKAIELKTEMQDHLDTFVPSKFYNTTEKAERLIGKLISDGTLPTQALKGRK